MKINSNKNDDQKGIFQQKITEGIEGAFSYVLNNRKNYFDENPEKAGSKDGVSRLIKSYTMNNATISGGATLIPGPWGMAAVVPELVLVLRNQIQMIYDIGMAHGKKENISQELLMAIFITALGSSAGSLIAIQGGKILVRRASLRAMQQMIAILGGKITQQAIKSSVSKWVPLAGAAAMATWTGYMTNKIGQKADQVFSHEIENAPNIDDIEDIEDIEDIKII